MMKFVGDKPNFANHIIYSSLILAFLLSLTITGLAHADDDPSVTSGVNYSVTVAPTLNVTIPTGPVILNLNSANKTFAKSDNLNIVVATNNPTGYELTMSSTGTSLVRDASLDGKNATIETLTDQTGGYTESAFSNCTTANCTNKWGYKNGSSNYIPFTTSSPILSNDRATGNDTTAINFASKIDNNQPAGSYSITLAFTAVANPLCVTSITGTMQAFNPAELCDDVTSGTLTDARDSKSYTVAKLADGNWWMTKNLDLAGGTELYSDTSDVADGYPSSGSSYYYKLPASNTAGFNSDTGEFVYNTSNRSADSYCSSSPGCYSYYSWLAATAGGKDASGTSVTGDGYNAAYSICPKGWRLPTATTDGVSRDTNNGYTGGDFYKMITKYMGTGVTTLNNGYYDNTNPNPFNTNAGPGTTPNFLLAGYYYSGSFYYGGSRGSYWSSSSRSSTYAYSLYFYSSYVASADYDARRNGFPVRCLLSGSSS